MLFDLPPEPPKFWLPPKPAIIRGAPDLVVPKRETLARERRRASAAATPASIVHTADPVSGADQTNYTFSSVAIGIAAASRRLLIGVGSRYTTGDRTVTLTVGGNSATEIVTVSAGADQLRSTLFLIAFPTGTTADIIASHSGGCVSCAAGVWAAYDLLSDTPTDFGSSIANPMTDSLSVSAGGIIVGYAHTRGNGAGRTHTWSGISKNFDEAIEGFIAHSGASDAFASAATPTLTVTPSGALDAAAAVFASFR